MINRQAKNRKTERRKKVYLQPCYNIEDIYKVYKEQVKDKPKFKLTLSEFRDIANTFHKEIVNTILNESRVVKLPYRFGEIGIKKKKMNYKYLKFDFAHYRKTGGKAYHVNSHSDDWIARWFWSKKTCVIPNKRFYSFTPADSNKKALANIMKQPYGHSRFLER